LVSDQSPPKEPYLVKEKLAGLMKSSSVEIPKTSANFRNLGRFLVKIGKKMGLKSTSANPTVFGVQTLHSKSSYFIRECPAQLK